MKGFAADCHNIMEQAEREMKELSEVQQNSIKKYLLGSLDDTVKMRQIEEKILLDDDFADHLAIAEDELVDEYLDGMLTDGERERFLNFFLVSPENKEKLRLVENLRKYAAKQTDAPQNVKQFSEAKPDRFDWRKLFGAPAWRFAAIALVLFGIGFGVWRTAFYQSDVERGLAQLQLAYQGERPVEARIAGFGYAPLNETRGANGNDEINNQRTRAEGFLLHAAAENATASSLQALGKFYLTEKKFDKADQYFERAAALAPNSAQLESDWGAALFEMGKKAVSEPDSANRSILLDKSLKHLTRAIELDPRLPEPRFNRALCLQALPSPEQAKQAWREYLTLDADSPWAEEARRNLQVLESQKSRERSAAELERDFLAAVRRQDNEEAWRLLSGNRELIQERYLPQRLAMTSLTAAESEKPELLRALQMAGELESTRIADPFASELAGFYMTLPASKVEFLKQAQQSVRDGYKLCLKLEYGAASKEFEKARAIFFESGDLWEAKLTEYLIGYSLKNDNQLNLSAAVFRELTEFSRQRNYKWLEVTSLYWLASSFTNKKQLTEARKNHERALSLAEAINDSYAVQRNLLELANISSFVGQKQQSVIYLQRVLAASPETSRRQKYRNYSSAHQILTVAKLYNAAKPIALEAVELADDLQDEMFMVLARNNAGIVNSLTGDFDAARVWLKQGREKAEAIIDRSSRERMLAYSFLKAAYVERQAGNYENSEQFYETSLKLYETMQMPFNRYEAQKGKLLAYLALGKNAELDEQIPLTLKLTEDYREEILEEQERTSFFDTEQSIYDIAADFEYGRGQLEKAYNYTETSNSRSLLDWLQKGAKVSGDRKKLEILLEENARPLTLSEIRERMPDKVQILQYSVLENKVLIWLISKEKFVVTTVNIQSAELREKVENYVKLLKQKNDSAEPEAGRLARELYDLLIAPIVSQLDPDREICLIPSKVLFYLSFVTLVAPNANYLLADFKVFYAPSANVFIFCTENAEQKDASVSETLLSVGNPSFDRRNFDLPNLPTAENEAREISAYYDRSHALFAGEATKKAFKDSLKDADIIHFAGHYVVVNNAPLSSHLLLAPGSGRGMPDDGVLANSELVALKLPRAKLVVLSACQTGVEHYYNGEGLIGLSRTFLAAGAPLVVASQWSVETEATAELMKRFHFYRQREKMPTVAALRKAQLAMASEQGGRFRQPYYWAAFAAFGGYTIF